MKKIIKFLISMIIFVLLLISVMPATAAVAPAVASGSPGRQVTINFSYSNIAGINGTFSYSNIDIFSDIDISVTGLIGHYNPDTGMIAYYGAKPSDTVITMVLTISPTAKPGDSCDITFEYESTTDGNLPSVPVYQYEYATVRVKASLDYSRLIKQIEEAEKLVKSEYTVASWVKLETALENAREALNSDSQTIVDDAANKLAEAIRNLVRYAVDYSELKKQIQLAEDLVEDEYTVSSWEILENALTKAKAAMSSKNQAVVDEAATNLEKARKSLVRKTTAVDYTELKKQIAIAESLDEDLYTSDSWEEMQEALTDAKAALKSNSQQTVNKAASELKIAIAALRKIDSDVDYSELNKQIAIAEELNENEYSLISWNLLEKCLEEAKEKLTSKSQSEVDLAANNLKDAIAKLVKMDYSALLAAIESVKEYAQSEELADLWYKMHELLNQAQILLSARDQQLIDKCTADIIQLLSEIIAAMEELKSSTIIEVEKPVPTNPDGDYCNVSAHKVWMILFIISAVLNVALIAVIVYYLYKKRKVVSDDTPLVDYDITDDLE